MKINKDTNEVTFNISANKINELELALLILNGYNPDEEFINLFVNRLSRDALRQSLNTTSRVIHGVRTPQPKDKLIKHWAERKELTIHKIFKSYLILKDKSDKVTSTEMEQLYNTFDPDNKMRVVSKFFGNFRLLCTEGRGAYGKFFDYDKITKEVNLTDEVSDLVYSLKELFLV